MEEHVACARPVTRGVCAPDFEVGPMRQAHRLDPVGTSGVVLPAAEPLLAKTEKHALTSNLTGGHPVHLRFGNASHVENLSILVPDWRLDPGYAGDSDDLAQPLRQHHLT